MKTSNVDTENSAVLKRKLEKVEPGFLKIDNLNGHSEVENKNFSKRNKCTTPPRKALGDIGNVVESDPMSPTANLRLLTKVASHIETSSQITTITHNEVVKEYSLSFHGTVVRTEEALKPRKEKSLSLLCNKFLQLYPLSLKSGETMIIPLDHAAASLGTERRRIYDIINVLESLEMATKIGKNRYIWFGSQNLPTTLAKLKGFALQQGLHVKIEKAQSELLQSYFRVVVLDNINGAQDGNSSDISSEMVNEESNTSMDQLDIAEVSMAVGSLEGSSLSFDEDSLQNGEALSSTESSSKKEKSLGVMCQKFMMLFLISNSAKLINLELAAKILIGDLSVDKPLVANSKGKLNRQLSACDDMVFFQGGTNYFKTKVRRLYDIANVLTSLGLISKVHTSESSMRKPAFKYTGPNVEALTVSNHDIEGVQTSRHSLLGNSTFQPPTVVNTSNEVRLENNDENICKTNLIENTLRTPVNSNKRKLKASGVKLYRTTSDFSFDYQRKMSTRHIRKGKGKLNDILHVAELELQKLESEKLSSIHKKTDSSQNGYSARKKLFRFHSDSCIETASDGSEVSRETVADSSIRTMNEAVILNNDVTNKPLNFTFIPVSQSKCVGVSVNGNSKTSNILDKSSGISNLGNGSSNIIPLTSVPFLASVPTCSDASVDQGNAKKNFVVSSVKNKNSVVLSMKNNGIILTPLSNCTVIVLADNGLQTVPVDCPAGTPVFQNMLEYNAVQKNGKFCSVLPSPSFENDSEVKSNEESGLESVNVTDGKTSVLPSSGSTQDTYYRAVKVGNIMQLVPVCNVSNPVQNL